MKFGDHVDRFGVLKKLSQGGMATVYLGFDPNNNQLVALKVLFRQCADEPVYVQRFHREVSILKSLAHRHVVGLIASGEHDGVPFAALEFVRGRPLNELMEKGPMTPEAALPIVSAVGRALSHAHAQKVVHRDIKPSNVIVGNSADEVKVLDFGVARAEDDYVKTSAGQFLGTVCYAAPEQMEGLAVDHRADLYSVGVMLYEMLAGKLPFQDTDHASIIRQQKADLYLPPSQVNTNLPKELDAPVMKLLRCDPRRRHESIDELLLELEQVQARARDRAFHSRSVYDFPQFLKTFQAATAAFEKRDLVVSQGLAEELAQKAPRAAEVFFLLGRIHNERGLIYNAIREFIKATAFDPENTFYHVTLGRAYESIGMVSEARSEYQAAVRHDPDSRLAQQRLEEVEKVIATIPDAGSPEPKLDSVVPGKPPRVVAAEGDDPALPPPPNLQEVQERYRQVLAERRPEPQDTRQLALGTCVWWGRGFQDLGLDRRVKWATITQATVVLNCALMLLLGQAVSHIPKVEGFWLLFADRTQLLAMCVCLYSLGTLFFLTDVLKGVKLLALQGYVIDHERGRSSWRVSLNIGRDRGVKGNEVFHIYKEEQRGSGRGRLVGQMYVTDVGENNCTGNYVPVLREPPSAGDFAVASATVRARLVTPEEPVPLRFPRISALGPS